MFYEGAGILFMCEDEVLLGLRNYNPHRDTWSIIGGKKEKHESFYTCAIREASEELKQIIFIPPENIIDVHAYEKHIPFIFRWMTFVIKINDKTKLDISKFSREFRFVRWFKISLLPPNLYPKLEETILKAFSKVPQIQNYVPIKQIRENSNSNRENENGTSA